MTSTVEQYQDALADYENAEDRVREVVGLFKKVNEGLYSSNLPSFLGWTFGITDQLPPGQRLDPKMNIDLANWPTRDDLQKSFTEWHTAWKRLHGAWESLPEERRRGFRPPPVRLEIRG